MKNNLRVVREKIKDFQRRSKDLSMSENVYILDREHEVWYAGFSHGMDMILALLDGMEKELREMKEIERDYLPQSTGRIEFIKELLG